MLMQMAPVAPSMPDDTGGSELRKATHKPAMPLPTSMAQTVVGAPAARAPGNMSEANETTLVSSTTTDTAAAARSRESAPTFRYRPGASPGTRGVSTGVFMGPFRLPGHHGCAGRAGRATGGWA